MGKAGIILLVVLALVLCAFVAYRWSDMLVLSHYGYRTPIKGAPPWTTNVTAPLTRHVVIVVIDGLRYDTSMRMPTLNALRQQGAQARLVFPPPSATQTAWTTLITGAGPETNDAPLIDRPVDLIQPARPDTLFAALGRAGLTSGIAGFRWWEKLVPPAELYVRAYVDSSDDAGDREAVNRAVNFLIEFQPGFLLVQLRQLEPASQAEGSAGAGYEAAAARCDRYLGLVAEAMDFSESVLLVVSSSGQLDEGGHGGAEVSLRLLPFVMVGQSVMLGSYQALSALDVAPLVAALLGAPIPAHAQGRIPTQMLRMNEIDAASKLLALAKQRIRIGSIYLSSIGRGTVSQTAEGDMLTSESSLLVKNFSSAAELASLSVQQADREMVRGRGARLAVERQQRLPLAASAVLVPLALLWLKRSRRTLWIVLTSAVSVELYHVLYLRQGNSYSFSDTPPGALLSLLLPNLQHTIVAVCAGAALLVWGLWRQRERSPFQVIKASYACALTELYLIGAGVAACAWWSGIRFTWYVPNLTVAIVHATLLMQAMLFALVAVVAPVPTVVALFGLRAASDWLDRGRPAKPACAGNPSRRPR